MSRLDTVGTVEFESRLRRGWLYSLLVPSTVPLGGFHVLAWIMGDIWILSRGTPNRLFVPLLFALIAMSILGVMVNQRGFIAVDDLALRTRWRWGPEIAIPWNEIKRLDVETVRYGAGNFRTIIVHRDSGQVVLKITGWFVSKAWKQKCLALIERGVAASGAKIDLAPLRRGF